MDRPFKLLYFLSLMTSAPDPQELQYIRTEDMPPHPTLVWALGNFAVGSGMRGLDLGCGAGRDIGAFLAAGVAEVVAVDHHPLFERYATRHIAPKDRGRVTFIHGEYQDAYPPGPFDIINAQLTLSHNRRETFDRVMATTRERLAPGGLFVGTFFGDRHPYNRPGTDFTFLTREAVQDLFTGMEFLRLNEHNEEGPTPYAGERWHWFDVVVQNRPPEGTLEQTA